MDSFGRRCSRFFIKEPSNEPQILRRSGNCRCIDLPVRRSSSRAHRHHCKRKSILSGSVHRLISGAVQTYTNAISVLSLQNVGCSLAAMSFKDREFNMTVIRHIPALFLCLILNGVSAIAVAEPIYVGRSSTSELVSVDTTNGIQQEIANAGTNYIHDMAFDSNGLLWTTTGYRLISYDVNTGSVVNNFALGPGDYNSLAMPPASVPEPQTILLVLAGLALLGRGDRKINRASVGSRPGPGPGQHLATVP